MLCVNLDTTPLIRKRLQHSVSTMFPLGLWRGTNAEIILIPRHHIQKRQYILRTIKILEARSSLALHLGIIQIQSPISYKQLFYKKSICVLQ